MCDNWDAPSYCSLFVMNISSILMVPRVVLLLVVIVIQNNSNDGINSCKACNAANLHTL